MSDCDVGQMDSVMSQPQPEPEYCTNCGRVVKEDSLVLLDDPKYSAVYQAVKNDKYVNAWQLRKDCAKNVLKKSLNEEEHKRLVIEALNEAKQNNVL